MIQIYDPTQTPKYALRLISRNGKPTLAIVESSVGKPIPGGYLLEIDTDGKLSLFNYVDRTLAEALGLQLNPDGHIAYKILTHSIDI